MKEQTPKAVALQYDGEGAPRVTAKGDGALADKIVALARAHNVPLREDPFLTALLSQVELQKEIPPELFEAVAQLLCFLYHINGKTPEEYGARE